MIDGLTPAVFERAVESGEAPSLSFLAGEGTYRRALSTFPSLTPVCASSIATGSHPDGHHIPHLVWYDREERRLIEYGSSFGAVVAAGTRRSILDTIFNMNGRHLSPGATTVFESLHDAGLTTAAVNFTCYRGRTEHRTVLPGVTRTAFGPERFFFYNLFESDDDRRAAGRPEARGGDDRRLRGRRRPLARHPRRLRLPRLLPCGLRLRLALARPGRRRREARRRRPRGRRAARGGRRTGRVPRALRRDPAAPTTARPRCTALLRSSPPTPTSASSAGGNCARMSPSAPPIARARCTACRTAAKRPARSPSASTATRRSTSSSSARTRAAVARQDRDGGPLRSRR